MMWKPPIHRVNLLLGDTHPYSHTHDPTPHPICPLAAPVEFEAPDQDPVIPETGEAAASPAQMESTAPPEGDPGAPAPEEADSASSDVLSGEKAEATEPQTLDDTDESRILPRS